MLQRSIAPIFSATVPAVQRFLSPYDRHMHELPPILEHIATQHGVDIINMANRID
jgi:hypothetical protein